MVDHTSGQMLRPTQVHLRQHPVFWLCSDTVDPAADVDAAMVLRTARVRGERLALRAASACQRSRLALGYRCFWSADSDRLVGGGIQCIQVLGFGRIRLFCRIDSLLLSGNWAALTGDSGGPLLLVKPPHCCLRAGSTIGRLGDGRVIYSAPGSTAASAALFCMRSFGFACLRRACPRCLLACCFAYSA